MNIAEQLADLNIARSLLLVRVGNGMGRTSYLAYKALIDDLVLSIKTATTEITKRNFNATIKELKKKIDIDPMMLNEDMTDLAKVESAYTVSSTNKLIGYDIFDKIPSEAVIASLYKNSIIMDSKGFLKTTDWYSNLNDSMKEDLQKSISMGVLQGETNAQISRRLQNSMNMRPTQAMTIAKTATSVVTNNAREEVWKSNDNVIKGYQRHEVLDSKTCMQCSSVDGKFYKKDEPKPPAQIHFSCRGIYSVVLKSYKELGVDISEIPNRTRSSLDGYVSKDTTFKDWFSTKDKAFQEEYLGRGRYELFSKGKITFNDLVNNRNRILTIEELKKK